MGEDVDELARQLNDILKAVAYHISKKDKRTALKAIQKGEGIVEKLGDYPALKTHYAETFEDCRKKVGAEKK